MSRPSVPSRPSPSTRPSTPSASRPTPPTRPSTPSASRPTPPTRPSSPSVKSTDGADSTEHSVGQSPFRTKSPHDRSTSDDSSWWWYTPAHAQCGDPAQHRSRQDPERHRRQWRHASRNAGLVQAWFAAAQYTPGTANCQSTPGPTRRRNPHASRQAAGRGATDCQATCCQASDR